MTPDLLICKAFGAILLALFLVLARLLTVTRRTPEPTQRREFIYATNPDGGEPIAGDYVGRDDWQ